MDGGGDAGVLVDASEAMDDAGVLVVVVSAIMEGG